MPHQLKSITEQNGKLNLEFNPKSETDAKCAKIEHMQRTMPLADYKYFSLFAPSQLHLLGVQLNPDKTESKYASYFKEL